MAITTVDLALAGMQPPVGWTKGSTAPTAAAAGIPFTLWATAGAPGASTGVSASTGTVLTSTAALVTGQLYRTNPGSGNSYLARFTASASVPGLLVLADRLLQAGNSSTGTISVTTTAAQTIGTPTLPARDINGNTAGIGVFAGIEITTTLGGGPATITLGYTNSTGTASHTAVNVNGLISASVAGQFYPIGLQSGDIGVQSIQTLTLSASLTSGAIEIVMYRPLAMLELPGSNIPNSIDALTSGFPRLYNGTVPYLFFIPQSTAAITMSGTYLETQG